MRPAGYTAATGFVLAAALVRAALEPLLQDKAPLLVFPAAVTGAAWVGGFSGGFFATGLSVGLGLWWFGPGDFLTTLSMPGETARAWLFISQGVLLTLLTGALRTHKRDLRAALASERQSREAAEQALRQRDHLLAIASHELRTPLNVILGWSAYLQRAELATTHRRAVEAIYRNACAEASVVEDLLDAAMAYAGVLTMDRNPVNISEVTAAAADQARAEGAAKGVQVLVTHELPPRYVVGDSRRLRQSIQKVAHNAIKFTPPGGIVRIEARTLGQHFEVCVQDTGIGIEPNFLPRVFERFQQQDQTDTRLHGGLGVGLAIVQEVVERHGGTVSASSEGQNRGATFTLRFPVALRAITAAPEPLAARRA